MKRILFVCVKNAGRSVMAEALLNQMAGRNAAEGISAGTAPQDRPHPEVVATLKEIGIDVSGHRGRLLTDNLVQGADRVITMGCAVDEKACPAVLYTNVEDWGLPDPKGQPADKVREIREEIKRRVEALLNELISERPDARTPDATRP